MVGRGNACACKAAPPSPSLWAKLPRWPPAWCPMPNEMSSPRSTLICATRASLNSVLGGSVSSRLFQEIREKRGLAYSIYSFLSGYSDSGMLTVYAATRSKEVDRVVDLTCREIRRIGTKGVERKELERAKTQMKGSLMLSLESSHSRMSKLAKDELTYGRQMSLEDLLVHIDRVNGEQVFNVARQFFKLDSLAITGLGPLASRSLQAYR